MVDRHDPNKPKDWAYHPHQMLKYKTLTYKYKYKSSHCKPNWIKRSILLACAGSNLCAQLHCKRLYKDIKHCWVLYETYVEFSVSEGVLISTATLENCFIPISRLLHFGIEKIGTARHLKRAPWQQVHPYHHFDVPYQEATLKYLCSATGSMLKSVGCDTSSLQKTR